MATCCYRIRYHEALGKAFAARADNVRGAYFDLACFYREKLNGQLYPFPTSEELRVCAGRLRAAKDIL